MDNKNLTLMEVRNFRVVKSNELIQRTRYQLTLQEQKIILFLISKIKPDDDELCTYTFQIKDFCLVCGIGDDNGKNYRNIKNTIDKLLGKHVWIKMPNGDETILRWIDRPYMNEKSGVIRIKLDELMKPYLLQLKEKFTQYNLYYILAMKSQYSIRLYEFFMSYEHLHEHTMTIDELREKLLIKEDFEYKNLKQRVIDVAVKEINELTDLDLCYEPIKTGARYTHIKFIMEIKKDVDRRMEAWANIEAILNKNSDS